MSIVKPIRFIFPNDEFPDNHNMYVSNVVTFWKPITNEIVENVEENRYSISTKGEIYDNKLNYPTPIVCAKGNRYYQQVNIKVTPKGFKTKKVHRLVKATFDPVENLENYQVNHIDGDHCNNNLSNLEWCTNRYNRIHSLINGLEDTVFGRPAVKLEPFEVRKIKVLRDQGYSYEKIIDTLGLRERGASRKTIEKIVHGKSVYSIYYTD